MGCLHHGSGQLAPLRREAASGGAIAARSPQPSPGDQISSPLACPSAVGNSEMLNCYYAHTDQDDGLQVGGACCRIFRAIHCADGGASKYVPPSIPPPCAFAWKS